ncbi:MAG: PDGLE domain-containing protein [Acidimicrobiales bacterium]|nr:PDGLE domain-containing protein [Acidimicrobiales bacterium]
MSADARRRRPAWLIGGFAVVVTVMVFVLAPNASSSPDGLEKVAADTGVDAEVRDHAFADGPLADYAVSGVDDATLSTGVAGTIGVVVTLVVTVAIGRVVSRRRAGPAVDTP